MTDKAGVIVPYADNLIRFEDRCPARHGSPLRHSASRRRAAMPRQAKIIGVNNGDLTSSEINNLAEKHPEIARQLAHKWHEWAERCQVVPKPKSEKTKK